MSNRTFAIRFLHPDRGLQLAFEVAANSYDAKKRFQDKHKELKVLTCTPTTQLYGNLKP